MRPLTRPGGLALLCIVMTSVSAQTAPTPRVIPTAEGGVTGQMLGGVAVFRGVPYAAAPEGERRWQPPQPAAHRDTVLDATAFGTICPQSRRAPYPLAGVPMGEDCLKLNIYVPAGAFDGGKRVPVMVWIHGGSYRWGAGSWPSAEPFALAHKGVAVVTINYRLDRLGLFAHPALSASMAGVPLANYALMDQVAALRWVRDNIAAFGGDPARVTVFGQSAGGVSVTTLMATPSAGGLFQAAIAQSGAARIEGDRRLRGDGGPFLSLEADGLQMAASFGIANDREAPARLRALPTDRIIAYSEKEMPNSMNPVVDGQVLPDDIARTFRAGRQQPVPFLSGTTNWEASLLGSYEFKLKDMLRGEDPAAVRQAYAGLDEATLVRTWFMDMLFRGPARFLAGEMSSVGKPAWFYEFSYVTEGRRGSVPGAAHSDDVAFAFGDPGMNRRSRADTLPTAADRRMAEVVSGYWVNFAKHGDPNGPGLPHWPRYERGTDLMLDLGTQVAVRKPARAEQLRFLDGLYETALGTR